MDLWTKKKCRDCGKEYFFGDGPGCECIKEREDWLVKYNEFYGVAFLF